MVGTKYHTFVTCTSTKLIHNGLGHPPQMCQAL